MSLHQHWVVGLDINAASDVGAPLPDAELWLSGCSEMEQCLGSGAQLQIDDSVSGAVLTDLTCDACDGRMVCCDLMYDVKQLEALRQCPVACSKKGEILWHLL